MDPAYDNELSVDPASRPTGVPCVIRLACVAIVKNEEAGIAEWLAFQLAIGFDTIILFDNRSTDDTVAQARALAANHDIRIIDWPHTTPDYQTQAYEHAIREWGAEFDWMAFFDTDEFLVLEPHFDLKGILNLWDDAAAIGVPWAIFGSSGHESRPDGLTIEAFQHRAPADFGPNRHIKSIVRPRGVKACLNPHAFEMDGPYRALTGNALRLEENTLLADPPDYSLGKLHHYFTRSRTHWETKMRRGYHDIDRPSDEFSIYNVNEIFDDSTRRFVGPVRAMLSAAFRGNQIGSLRKNVSEARNIHSNPTELSNPLTMGFVLGWESALLGNCLSSFANLFALAERTGVLVAYPQLNNVDNVVDTEWCCHTVYSRQEDIEYDKINFIFRFIDSILKGSDFKNILVKTLNIDDLVCAQDIRNSIIFLTYTPAFKNLEIHENEIKNFCARGNGIIMLGCYWYQYFDVRLLKKEGELLRSKLRIKNADASIERTHLMAEGRNAVRVGIHMRRASDYRSWINGDFFFEVEYYVSVIKILHEELKDRKHYFFVCSDVKMEESLFDDLPVCYVSASPEDDFKALSECDYVVGPPSTFGTWAAFLGKGRRVILTKDRIQNSSAWQPFLDSSIDVVYPTAAYVPCGPFFGPL